MSTELELMTEERDYYKREAKMWGLKSQRAQRRFGDLQWCIEHYGPETYWAEYQKLDQEHEAKMQAALKKGKS